MLSRDHRLTSAKDFTRVVRGGSRAGCRRMVVHVLPSEESRTRVGFVVGATVGNSVARHRVVRRLREQVRPLLRELPQGTLIVVRALPSAASSTSADLGEDLVSCASRAVFKLGQPRREATSMGQQGRGRLGLGQQPGTLGQVSQ